MNSELTRAQLRENIEDYGSSRVMDAARRAFGKFHLSVFTDEALEEILSMLREDEALQDRINARNRELRQPVSANTIAVEIHQMHTAIYGSSK